MFRYIFRGRSENINRRGEGWGRKKNPSLPAHWLVEGLEVLVWHSGMMGKQVIVTSITKKSGGNTLSIRVGSLQQTIITTL